MNGYTGIFKMSLVAGMQYRAAAWAGVATQFFWGFMKLMIYDAFYRSAALAQPMEFSQLAAYIWLQQAFLAMIMLWIQDADLFEAIVSGQVAYELCRPCRLYWFWFARLAATRLARTALRCLPILTITFFLPARWRMSLPASPGHFLLFLLLLVVSLLLVTAISMFIYMLTFITLNPGGVRLAIGAAAEFLAGGLLPIPFMPPALQAVLRLLPFASTADLPFRVYSGNIPLPEALAGLAIALAWLAALVLFGQWCFGRVQKRILIQGG